MELAELVGLRPFPAAGLLLGLTRRCPLRCGHCSTGSDLTVREEPDAGQLLRFVGSFTEENRPDVVMLTGGEPLLLPTLAGELSFLARRAGSRTAVLSGMFFARSRRSRPRSCARSPRSTTSPRAWTCTTSGRWREPTCSAPCTASGSRGSPSASTSPGPARTIRTWPTSPGPSTRSSAAGCRPWSTRCGRSAGPPRGPGPPAPAPTRRWRRPARWPPGRWSRSTARCWPAATRTPWTGGPPRPIWTSGTSPPTTGGPYAEGPWNPRCYG